MRFWGQYFGMAKTLGRSKPAQKSVHNQGSADSQEEVEKNAGKNNTISSGSTDLLLVRT